MLIAAGVALALTALLAGFTGSWSPCGLSSVETIGSGLGRKPTRAARLLTLASFTAFSVLGGIVTFGGVSLIGGAVGLDLSVQLTIGLAAVAALLAGTADLRFLPVVPQVRNQVPEAIRHRLPLLATGALYGLLLGLGFTTYLLTYAMWALLLASFVLSTPVVGLTVGVAFGVGRALPVLILAGRYDRAATQTFIGEMETGPLLRGMRRITGLALVVSAALLVPVAATHAANVYAGSAADPSVAPGAMTYLRPDGTTVLRRPAGDLVPLPGEVAAVGGGFVAWYADGVVTVADLASLEAVQTFRIGRVDALALSKTDIAYRTTGSRGRSAITVRSIAGDIVRTVERATAPASVGPPAVSGDLMLYAVSTRRTTRVIGVRPDGTRRRTVREGRSWAVVDSPAVQDRTLAYVRRTPCDQTLMLGGVDGPKDGRRDRALLRLRSTVERDGGYERGYPDAYNAASRCPKRQYSSRRGTLGTTALGSDRALVTLLGTNGTDPRVVEVRR